MFIIDPACPPAWANATHEVYEARLVTDFAAFLNCGPMLRKVLSRYVDIRLDASMGSVAPMASSAAAHFSNRNNRLKIIQYSPAAAAFIAAHYEREKYLPT